jgi:hypothetical protein
MFRESCETHILGKTLSFYVKAGGTHRSHCVLKGQNTIIIVVVQIILTLKEVCILSQSVHMCFVCSASDYFLMQHYPINLPNGEAISFSEIDINLPP